MKHKHADLIHAWADDADMIIEAKQFDGSWFEIGKPQWNDDTEYRIKPEPTPDLSIQIHVTRHSTTSLYSEPNLRLTFDGETGKLKSAEVL